MLKRVFLLLAFILATVFLCWQLGNNQNQIRFSHYPTADVIGTDASNHTTGREELSRKLNVIANQNQSVIARRIVAPTIGQQTRFVYEKYGSKHLPGGLPEANKTLAQTSDLANSYLIIGGSLTPESLTNSFRQLGYTAVSASKQTLLSLLTGIVVVPTVLLSLTILLLCFMAMTLIYRIKSLKEAGIKLIAGRTAISIVLEPALIDTRDILITMLLSGIAGTAFLQMSGLFQFEIVALLWLGLFLLALAFVAISILLSFVYLFGLNKTRLIQLLKGRLPLKWLLLLILLSQLTAIVLAGDSLATSLSYRDELREQQRAQSRWQQNPDRYALSFGAFANGISEQVSLQRDKIWYRFINHAVNDHDALLANNNLNRYQESNQSDGVKESDYLPRGHTVYVTPNYFKEQHIALSHRLQTQLNHLSRGQFGLILPEKLRSRQKPLIKTYTQYMNSFGQSGLSSHSRQLYTFQAKTGFTSNHQRYFLYNTNFGIIDTQFITDPIIVVLTPTSTGSTPSTNMFWSSVVGNSILFKGYRPTISLLKQDQVYPWVSYLQNARLRYWKNTQILRTQLLSTLVGTIMSVIVSIILFALTNLLYFEEFRREIFIKRVSGFNSWSIHSYYLLAQAVVLFLAAMIIFILTSQAAVAIVTFTAFFCLAGLMIYQQITRENQQAVTILKGK